MLELEPVEPVVVEPVLVPVLLVLGFVLLPVLVLGVSFRTCLVTLSQHFTVAEDHERLIDHTAEDVPLQ